MVTIQVTPSGTFRVKSRRRGLPTFSKAFKSRKAPKEWVGCPGANHYPYISSETNSLGCRISVYSGEIVS